MTVSWKVAAGVGITYGKCKMILTKAMGMKISAKFFPQVTTMLQYSELFNRQFLGSLLL
jgi:hypothetical protein